MKNLIKKTSAKNSNPFAKFSNVRLTKDQQHKVKGGDDSGDGIIIIDVVDL